MNSNDLDNLTGTRGASAVFRGVPSEDDGLVVRPHGDVSRVEVRFFIYEDVLNELMFAAEYRDDLSLAILLGAFALDHNGPFVEVSGFEEFSYVGAERDLYSKTRPALERVTEHLHRQSGIPDRHVVGLFASLPESDGVITPELARTHLSLFNIPFQIALAFDPAKRRLGAFVRPPRSRFENTPFWTVGAPTETDVSAERVTEEPAESLASAISDAVDESG